MDDIKKVSAPIAEGLNLQSATRDTAPQTTEQLIAQLHPDRDNEALVFQIAERNYLLLIDLILTQTHLDYRVTADLIKGVVSEWTSHPEAAERALLNALHRPEAIIQREALRGLDEMWREGHQQLAAQVAQQALIVPHPRWAILNG